MLIVETGRRIPAVAGKGKTGRTLQKWIGCPLTVCSCPAIISITQTRIQSVRPGLRPLPYAVPFHLKASPMTPTRSPIHLEYDPSSDAAAGFVVQDDFERFPENRANGRFG